MGLWMLFLSMATFRCDECGRIIETDILQCPNCNAPIGKLIVKCKTHDTLFVERIASLSSNGVNTFISHDLKCENKVDCNIVAEFIYNSGKSKYDKHHAYADLMGIKTKIVMVIVLILSSLSVYAQKKPILMILPSDNWCTQRYFTTEFENQGETIRIPNYQQAFQEDIELNPVISKVGELMSKLGYSLKDAEFELKNISVRISEDNATYSKSSNSELTESPLDILKRRAKADIIIQLGWILNRVDNGRSVTFTLEAFDSYTSKRIATATGTSKKSNEEIPLLLQHAVEKHIKAFDKQLGSYYDQMKKEGREIVISIRTWDSWEKDLESEYGNDELINHILKWMQKNTVNEQFNLSDATENFAMFEQVKIPLKDNVGLNMDARSFIRNLQKHLNNPPFNITSKLMMRGLGEAILVLGEK